jgi:hypothetical protein
MYEADKTINMLAIEKKANKKMLHLIHVSYCKYS